MENKLYEIEQAANQQQRRQDVYNLDELNEAVSSTLQRVNNSN